MLAAFVLQGCDVPHIEGYLIAGNIQVATHSVAEWRARLNYWEQNSYVDPATRNARFNSCMNPMLSILQVCSGHGHCSPFEPNEIAHPVFFCKCNDEWGGVECDTRRKRQSVAWLLSLLFGPLALDELYLGIPEQAMAKLLWTILGCTVGVLNFHIGAAMVGGAWMLDVVRIGSGPVLTSQYRVQEDLPRSAFAVFTILYYCGLAVVVATASMYRTVIARRRRYDQMLSYSSAKRVAM